MKIILTVLLSGAALAAASSSVDVLSPVTRVAELLQQLREKVEHDQKIEEDLYEKYACWAKTVVGAKTASNEQAQTRTDSLQAYIADLDAGRIEFTTERVDLEKEISTLTQDVETAEALRSKEHEDYLAAKDELEKAIGAVNDAMVVLQAAAPGSSFLSMGTKLDGKDSERESTHESLARAVDVGRRFLSPGDASFLERLLTADVPIWDWKKLNRKATFKMKYESRSKNIQQTLAGLLAQFSGGLADVERKEQEAAGSHQTLMTAKRDQLQKAQQALSKMELEGAARGLSRSEAVAEVQALKTQMDNDKIFIQQVQDALAAKKTEWQDRQAVRQDEIQALGQAIAVLHSDDARDLFKRSLASQGYSLLQRAASARREAGLAAAGELQRASAASGDRRLAALAALAATGHFDRVIAAIDAMMGVLRQEELTDISTKEDCERVRANDTRAAAVTSRAIDDLSDTITRLEQEIVEIEAEIEQKNQEIAEINRQLVEAEKVRNAEHAEWLKSDKDDEDAAALLAQAKTVLEGFYTQHSLLQEAPEMRAGEAPPPPPATWSAPYAGKQEENKSIVAILDLIRDDILGDKQKAKSAEDASAGAYSTMVTESTTQIGVLQGSITALTGTKATKATAVQDTKGERITKTNELKAVVQKLKDAAPGCDFFTVNFDVRSRQRQVEMDGLVKAKAVLQGADFSVPDPSRELRPGDALVQRVARHA